jgi:hypothetical protein
MAGQGPLGTGAYDAERPCVVQYSYTLRQRFGLTALIPGPRLGSDRMPVDWYPATPQGNTPELQQSRRSALADAARAPGTRDTPYNLISVFAHTLHRAATVA